MLSMIKFIIVNYRLCTINYDLIVCNPPYVSTSSKDNMLKDVQDFEPEIALFAKDNGLKCFKMVLDNLIKHENKKLKCSQNLISVSNASSKTYIQNSFSHFSDSSSWAACTLSIVVGFLPH